MSSLTETSPKPADSDKKKDLLSFLESEIKLITEIDKFPGWTHWAIAVGIASLIWTFAGLLSEKINLHLTVAMAITFGLIADCGFAIHGLSTVLRQKMIGRPRYDMAAAKIFEHPVHLGFSVCRFVAAIVLAWFVPLDLVTRIGACVLYGLYLLSFSQGVFVAIKGMPIVRGVVPGPESQLRRILVISFYCYFGLAICGILFFSYQLTTWGNFKSHAEELKGALVIVGLVYLCALILTRHAKNPLIESLISIRRQLGLGQISPETAKRQAEIVLTGFGEADVLREKLHMILKCYEDAAQEVQAIDASINEAKTKLPQTEGPFTDEEHALICKTRNFIVERLKRIGEIGITQTKHVDKLNFWIRVMLVFNPRAQPHIAPLLEKLNSAGNDWNQKMAALNQRGEWFVRAVDTAKDGLPSSTPTTAAPKS